MKLLRRLQRALLGRRRNTERAAARATAETRREDRGDRRSAAIVRRAAAHRPIAGGPDFICVGMQKAGTLWFYEQMGNHPEIWQPPIKELHVLNGNPTERTINSFLRRFDAGETGPNPPQSERGRRAIAATDAEFVRRLSQLTSKEPDLAGYADLFALKGSLKSGDVTPAYSTLTDRIISPLAGVFPELRIVLIVREPVDRAWSSFVMTQRRLGEHEPNVVFDDWAAVAEVVTKRGNAIRSSPSAIHKRWKRRFGDRVGLFFFDDLKDDAEALRRRVSTFIGVDPGAFGPLPADHNRKASRGKLVMSDTIRARLVDHYAAEIHRSATVLGGRAAEWPGRYGL